MKIFKFLSHPYTLLICFCLIIISGEHLGGFYSLYILLGLFIGAVHSLLAVSGIIVLLISYHRFRNRNLLAHLLNMTGLLMLLGSLFYFFWNDKEHYNYGTFEQTIPVLTLVLFALIAACFLIGNFSSARIKTTIVA